MNDGIATPLTGLAMTRILKHLPWTTGLPEGELPRRGKRGHPGVRALRPRNDVVLLRLSENLRDCHGAVPLAMTCSL